MYQELATTITQLSLAERLALLEVLAQSLREDMQTSPQRQSSLVRVRGMLKSDNPLPSKTELDTAYTDYLIEKYT